MAIGLVELRGLTASIHAADAMTKSAGVIIIGTEKIGSGLVTIFVKGEVSAVQAAIEVGEYEASRLGELVCAHVIARPHEELKLLFPILK